MLLVADGRMSQIVTMSGRTAQVNLTVFSIVQLMVTAVVIAPV